MSSRLYNRPAEQLNNSMANDRASIIEGYDDFLRDLKERIRSA